MGTFKTNAACIIFREAVMKSRRGDRVFSLPFEQIGVDLRSDEFREALLEIQSTGVLQLTVADSTKIDIFIVNDLSDVFE